MSFLSTQFSRFTSSDSSAEDSRKQSAPPIVPVLKRPTERDDSSSDILLSDIPILKLSRLLRKPVATPDGALLPLGGVTFSLSGGKIRHLIVRCGTFNEDVSELYLPFSSASLSAWRIMPESLRPRSPKGTNRLIPGKPVYSVGGTYYGKLTDALIKNGVLTLLYVDSKAYSAANLYAAGDAILLRPAHAYPLGQPMPRESSVSAENARAIRFRGNVTRSALKYFLREGKLIRFTTSLPLFQNDDVRF